MFEIDKEKCIHCGLCVKDCSPKALQFNDEKIPVIDEKNVLNASIALLYALPEQYRFAVKILKIPTEFIPKTLK